MKIGFDAKRAFFNFRGLGNYSRGIIEGLNLYYPEHELFLFTPNFKDTRSFKWRDSLREENINIISPDSMIEKLIPSYWRSFHLEKYFSKLDLDIYHGLSHEIPQRKNKPKTKVIVTMHDLIFMRYPEYFPMLDRKVYLRKFKYACDNSDKIIAICNFTKNDLINLLNVKEEKIIVHYQSCDPNFYKNIPMEERQQILHKYGIRNSFILNVGAFEPRKNQLALINAFSIIKDQVEEDLILIGSGKEYLQECQILVKKLKLENRVHFLSNVSFFDLPAIYQESNLFCFPSIFEGFGIPIVEALFSRTPVITSVGSCFPESAGEGSYFINPLKVEEIASAMIRILNNDTLRNQMITKGIKHAETFHLQNTSARLAEIYSQVNQD